MKVTPDHVLSLIEHSQFHRFKGTTTTVCCITLLNGHTVVGKSACADPDEFKPEVGQKIAYDNAVSKIYALEGYLLSETLHRERKVTNAEQAFNERSASVGSILAEGFVNMVEKGRGQIENKETPLKADFAEHSEWPPLNIELHFIEEEPEPEPEQDARDNMVFHISDEERTMMKQALAMGSTVIRTDEGEQWKLVGLCDEGAICEYAGEVDE